MLVNFVPSLDHMKREEKGGGGGGGGLGMFVPVTEVCVNK